MAAPDMAEIAISFMADKLRAALSNWGEPAVDARPAARVMANMAVQVFTQNAGALTDVLEAETRARERVAEKVAAASETKTEARTEAEAKTEAKTEAPAKTGAPGDAVELLDLVQITFRAPDGRAIAFIRVPDPIFVQVVPEAFEMPVASVEVAEKVADLLFRGWEDAEPGKMAIDLSAARAILGCPHIDACEDIAAGAREVCSLWCAKLGISGMPFDWGRSPTGEEFLRKIDELERCAADPRQAQLERINEQPAEARRRVADLESTAADLPRQPIAMESPPVKAETADAKAQPDLGDELMRQVRIVFRAPDGRALGHMHAYRYLFEKGTPDSFELPAKDEFVTQRIIDLLLGGEQTPPDGEREEYDKDGPPAVRAVLACPYINPIGQTASSALALWANGLWPEIARHVAENIRAALLRGLDTLEWSKEQLLSEVAAIGAKAEAKAAAAKTRSRSHSRSRSRTRSRTRSRSRSRFAQENGQLAGQQGAEPEPEVAAARPAEID